MFSFQAALESSSRIVFTKDASEVFSVFLGNMAEHREMRDHLHLAAAEIALATSLSDEATVSPDSARLAALHYDCYSWRHICTEGPPEGPDGPTLRYSDLTVFSADAERLENVLGGPFDRVQPPPGVLARAVLQMEDNYRDSALTAQARDSHILRWQGVIWHLQLSAAEIHGYVHSTPEETVEIAVKVMHLS
ncbi:hypothetical protein ACWDTQ_12520 [Streptomyces cellulosae]